MGRPYSGNTDVEGLESEKSVRKDGVFFIHGTYEKKFRKHRFIPNPLSQILRIEEIHSKGRIRGTRPPSPPPLFVGPQTFINMRENIVCLFTTVQHFNI